MTDDDDDATTITLASSNTEAIHILSVMHGRHTDPQIAAIALILATAKLIGEIAHDQQGVERLARPMWHMLTTHAKDCCLRKADTLRTMN